MNQLLFQAPILALVLAMISSITVVTIGIFMGRRVIEYLSIFMSGVLVFLSAITTVNVFFMEGSYTYCMGGWPPPIGIPYVIDHFSAPLGLVVSVVFFATVLYSTSYIEKSRDVKWYYCLMFLMQAGMFGLIFTADFFHIFVMLELMGLSAIILVSFRKERKSSVEASIKYGIYEIVSISIYYLTTAMIFGMFGSMAIAEVSAKLGGYISPVSGGMFADVTIGLPVIVALLIWSFAIGAAIVPQHFWLPDAHSMAPSSISAILSGLLVQINIAVLARLLFDGLRATELPATAIGLDALIILGVVSSVTASAFMLVQTDIKRLIAYSTIANVGLISIGLGLASVTSISAAYLHIVNHAFVKAALFMIAGILIYATGSQAISSYKGISKSMPFISLLFLISALAGIGFPPLSMFWSKLLLMYSVVQEGGIFFFLLLPIVITVIFEAIAMIRVLATMYSGQSVPILQRPSKLMIASVLLMIAVTVFLGLIPNLTFEFAGIAATDLLDFQKYIALVLGALPLP
jgi:multicomponent Na+:H+ antiporter subunit D